MKKIPFLLMIFFIIITLAYLPFKTWAAKKMAIGADKIIMELNPDYIYVNAEIETDTCSFIPCITLKDTSILFMQTPASGGNIQIRLQSLFPISFGIETLHTPVKPQVNLSATLSGSAIQISYIELMIGTFSANINGHTNTQTGQTQCAINTVNLADFLIPKLPPNIQMFAGFFLRNAPQTLSMQDQNGWMTIQGIPIFPIQ